MQGVRYYSDAWRRCGIFFQRGVIAQPNGFSRWLKKFFKVKSEIKSEQVWSCWRRMLCGWFSKKEFILFLLHTYDSSFWGFEVPQKHLVTRNFQTLFLWNGNWDHHWKAIDDKKVANKNICSLTQRANFKMVSEEIWILFSKYSIIPRTINYHKYVTDKSVRRSA